MKACDVAGCEDPARSSVAPHCEKHYYRLRRTGSLEARAQRPARGICTAAGCAAPDEGPRGLCSKHATRERRHGDHLTVIAPVDRQAPKGESHPSHVADGVTYSGMHQRLAAVKGPAAGRRCVDCGEQARHWSYDHNDPDEKRGRNGRYMVPYSAKVEHYAPRCVPCHKAHDLAVTA